MVVPCKFSPSAFDRHKVQNLLSRTWFHAP
jgi:hypothetical protein